LGGCLWGGRCRGGGRDSLRSCGPHFRDLPFADDEYFATDGLCTHEKVHLSGGLVMDNIIECPKHNGRFNYKTGEAKGAPVCVNLQTYPVKVEAGKVMIQI
jgi:MocE subfamily Rieske [2Fe-2S] domain protein